MASRLPDVATYEKALLNLRAQVAMLEGMNARQVELIDAWAGKAERLEARAADRDQLQHEVELLKGILDKVREESLLTPEQRREATARLAVDLKLRLLERGRLLGLEGQTIEEALASHVARRRAEQENETLHAEKLALQQELEKARSADEWWSHENRDLYLRYVTAQVEIAKLKERLLSVPNSGFSVPPLALEDKAYE